MTFKNIFIEANKDFNEKERTTLPKLNVEMYEATGLSKMQIDTMDETLQAAVGILEDHAEVLSAKPESIVIYHGNCADGFTAALAFWLKYGNTMEYYPGVYSEPPPDVEGKTVYLVDFSYKKEVVQEMLDKANRIYFIDHHKTSIEDLKDLSDVTSVYYNERFSAYTDLNRSGAMLAWDFIYNCKRNSFRILAEMKTVHPEYREAPKLFHYVQDRDLWKKELPWTDAFSANLFSYEYYFVEWAGIMSDVENMRGFTKFCEAGEAILRKQQKDITELLKVTERLMFIGDHSVPCASMPYTLSSEAGHQMLTDDPSAVFAACYWDTATHRIFSLRSTGDRKDVSEIAKLYGGGGHRNAAGFRVPREHILARS